MTSNWVPEKSKFYYDVKIKFHMKWKSKKTINFDSWVLSSCTYVNAVYDFRLHFIAHYENEQEIFNRAFQDKTSLLYQPRLIKL